MITIALAAITVTKFTMIPLASGYTEARICGISADGLKVVGLMTGGSKSSAFIWDEKTGTRDLGSLSWNIWRAGGGIPEFDENGQPIDRVGIAPNKMRWARSVAFMSVPKTDIKTFKTPWLLGGSANGKVIFGNGTGKSGPEGFVWSKETGAVGVGDLKGGFFYSQANGISPEGDFVVGCSKDFDGITAAVWNKAAGLSALRYPKQGRNMSRALCCSSSAKTVGGEAQTDKGMEAVIWVSGREGLFVQNLAGASAADGWNLTDCSCVSDDGGTIAGTAAKASGETRVWIARIVSR